MNKKFFVVIIINFILLCFVNSVVAQEEIAPQKGYIIEFEDKSIIEKKTELDKEAKEAEEYIEEHPVLSTVTGYRFWAVTPKKVPEKVKKFSKDLETNHEKIKNNILLKTTEKRAKITGQSISGESSLNVEGEYKKVFNGIALDISTEEAKEIEKIPGVKAVYPNLRVNINLMDSVPLINADEVWELDKFNGNCLESGEPCLTGEGTSIAILDTGIDYTHVDLGGGCDEGGDGGISDEIMLSPNIEDYVGSAVSGDIVVWTERKLPFSGVLSIYSCNLKEATENLTQWCGTLESYGGGLKEIGFGEHASISGDKIVWDYDGDIYLYDLSTNTEKLITVNPSVGKYPSISGDKIVWEDYRNNPSLDDIGNSDIYLYDLSTNTETQITKNITSQTHPVIEGDKIIWLDRINIVDIPGAAPNPLYYYRDIYMYDLSTGEEKRITKSPSVYYMSLLDISGNKIVWHDERESNFEIYMYDLLTNQETPITTGSASHQFEPKIDGNRIIWKEYLGTYSIYVYLYDLSTGQKKKLTPSPTYLYGMGISENKIIWERHGSGPGVRQVYLSFIEEDAPSGPNCNKFLGGYDFVNNDGDPMDDHYHGTHVAGIAAGSGEGGLKGVAPDAGLYAYKVLNSAGSGYFSWIISGIERAVDPNQDGDVSDHADVISMSLGARGLACNTNDPTIRAIDSAIDAGVVVVVSAGNSGPSSGTIGYPACHERVITVGATYKNDNLVYFSSRGPAIEDGQEIIKPDIVAPGYSICSAKFQGYSGSICFDSSHISKSGTSMSCPHVSGAVALLRQKNPNLTPEEIKEELKKTAKDLPYSANEVGDGRLDLLKAVTVIELIGHRIKEVTPYSVTIEFEATEPVNATVKIFEEDGGSLISSASDFQMKQNHSIQVDGLEPSTEYFYEISMTDIDGGKADYEGEIFYTRTTSKIPELPTTFYGKVITTDGDFVEGVKVTAKWIDIDDNVYYTGVNTLTLDQAIELGDETLIGYFMFNQGRIKAKSGSKIEVSAPGDLSNPDPYILADPGNNAEEIINGPLLLSGALPEITIINPESREYDGGELPIMLIYNVSKFVKEASYTLNGVSSIIFSDENQSIELDVLGGANVLTLDITDITNLQASKTVEFTVLDSTSPNISLDNVIYSKESIFVSASVFDELSTLASCEVCISSNENCNNKWVSGDKDFNENSLSGKCSYALDKSQYSSGDYLFKFRVSDNSGNIGESIEGNLVVDNIAPQQVTNAQAMPIQGENALMISWDSSSESEFKEYRIYRSSGSGELIKIITDISETSFKDIKLESEKTYTYRITVVDNYYNENLGVTVSGSVADTVVPIVTVENPEHLKIYNYAEIPLQYTVSEESDCSYSLNGANNSMESIITAREGENNLIVFCDDGFNNGSSREIIFYVDTIAPPIITELSVVQRGTEPILDLEWEGFEDVDEYAIYRDVIIFDNIVGMNPIATTKLTQYADLDLEDGTYYYAITSRDKAGNINNEFNLVGATISLDTIAPPPITNLQITQIEDTTNLELTWDLYDGVDFSHYNIYRSYSEFDDVSEIMPVAKKTSNSFNDESLEPGVYYYAVTAVDKSLNENKEVDPVSIEVVDDDTSNPVINVNNAGEQAYGTIELQADVSDNKGLKESCQVCISSDGICSDEWISSGDDFDEGALNGKCSYSWNTRLYEKTRYTYNFRVSDLSNNQGQGNQRQIFIIEEPLNNLTCSDGTAYDQCSNEKPKYCENGTLVFDCQSCGCEQGYSCNSDGTCSVEEPKCSDGTFYDECSNEKPKYCENGNLIDRCTTCGCNPGFYCDIIAEQCLISEENLTCSDGTPYGQCSSTQPKYCENGNLIDRCTTCGCSGETDCNDETNSCEIVSPINEIRLYEGWNLFSIPVELPESSIGSVLSPISGKYRAMFSYDSSFGKWLIYKPEQTLFDQSNSLTNLESGKAYWIDMSEDVILDLQGSEITSHKVDLTQGWNFIGWPYEEAMPIKQALLSLGDKYDIIYTYDSQSGEWLLYSLYPSQLYQNTLNEMAPQEGYWIYLYESSTWQP